MKKIYFKHFLVTLLLLCSTVANAHDFEVDGIYYNITSSSNKTVEVTYRGTSFDQYSNEYTGSVVIPSSVTYNGTTYSVTSIGDDAFWRCTGLTSVTIPNSVTSIVKTAFLFCDGLTNIIVENGNSVYDSRENCNAIIVTATNALFVGCKNTIIPNSVTSIGDGAFWYCTGLTSVTIPNSVTSIGEYAFYSCSGLTSVTIGNGVTSIGKGAFYYCSGLTSITIPNGVTSIGEGAFYCCSGLTSVTIGNGVTSIGEYAFMYCDGLKEIYVKATTPPTINSSVFYGVPTASAILYVPVGSKDAYAAANGWSEFYNIVEMEFTGIDEVVDEVKGENSKVKDVYDLSGRKVTNPTKGIYIVNGKKVLLK